VSLTCLAIFGKVNDAEATRAEALLEVINVLDVPLVGVNKPLL
jgi:hypothetical protein